MKVFLMGFFSCVAGLAAAEVDFAHQVVPILETHCVECHGGDEAKGGVSFNTRELLLDADVLDVGRPDISLFIEVLREEDPDYRMPPPGKDKAPVSDAELLVLKNWIAQGVKWEAGFTFAKDRYEPPLKPREVVLPKGPAGANPLDLLVEAYFEETGITPPKPLGDKEFVRRLSLDLHGVVPSGAHLELVGVGRKVDRAALIEEFLNDDRRYAEHWMTFWNDLLRNEYVGTGYIEGGRKQVTGWLYRALLENKPYDHFVRELVSPSDDSRGFIDGFKWRGEVNASQTQEIQFSQNVSQVLLGINMKCASCHDSFLDQWSLADAYGLAAIVSEEPLELVRCDIPTGRTAKPAWLFPELGEIDAEAPKKERLSQLAELMVHPENGRMQRTIVNRLWTQLMGRGIVHPVDAMNTEPWSEEVLDYLANTLVESGYDLKAVLRLIVSSKIYQAESEVTREGSEYVFRGPVRKRLTAEEFLDSIRTVIGVWPEPEKGAFGKSSRGGQLTAVMNAHGLKKWDGRDVRAVFAGRDVLQATLGRPNREQVVTSRPDQLTTLEAIALANGPELSGLLRAGAERLGETVGNSEKLIDTIYLQALIRKPTPQELVVARSLIGGEPSLEAIEDFLWMIFMMPEFQYNN